MMVVSANFSVERPLSVSLRLPKKLSTDGVFPSRAEVLQEVLDIVPKASIFCFQKLSATNFDCTFKSGREASRDLLLASGISYKGYHLEFFESAPKSTAVTIKNLPAEVSDMTLTDRMSEFGGVFNISHSMEDGLWNGDRIVDMKVLKDIPSLVMVGKYPAYARYRGQRLCCHHCNRWGHAVKNCEFKLNNLCIRCGSSEHSARDCSMPWGSICAIPSSVRGPAPRDANKDQVPSTSVDENSNNPVQPQPPPVVAVGASSAAASSQSASDPSGSSVDTTVKSAGSKKREQPSPVRPASKKLAPKPKENPFEGTVDCSLLHSSYDINDMPFVDLISERRPPLSHHRSANRFDALTNDDETDEVEDDQPDDNQESPMAEDPIPETTVMDTQETMDESQSSSPLLFSSPDLFPALEVASQPIPNLTPKKIVEAMPKSKGKKGNQPKDGPPTRKATRPVKTTTGRRS